MTRSTVLLVATFAGGAACALTACGDRKAAPGTDTTAATGAASSPDTVSQSGVWSDSVTAESRYSARYVQGRLAVIEEQMLFADSTRSSRRYTYDENVALTHLSERRSLMVAAGDRSPTLLQSTLDLYFTGAQIDSATKRVDNVAKAVQPYEIDNMRKHERELFARVSATSTIPGTSR